MLFAGDLVLIATSEDDLPYNLNTVTSKYNMDISTEKTKILAF
jgi:hypothetical protein